MCGISGIVSFAHENVDVRKNLQTMSTILRHRGPDDEGFFYVYSGNNHSTSGGVDTPVNCYLTDLPYAPKRDNENSGQYCWLGLAHRRLSIIDLHPTGHQPMCSLNQNLWLVFNGEIYNYIEIKKKLEKLGAKFYTLSDTEVVLRAYEYWGKECFQEFNGMWSIAIYDKNSQTLLCSRDRFGVKPFYYYWDSKIFAFASEQKALVAMPFINTEINNAAAFQYLVMGTTESEEQGLFHGILELMPGHHLTLDTKNRTLKTEKYYQLEYNYQWEDFSAEKFSNYVAETKELFIQAVGRRLRSDAPIGSCLSGGIDSSSIVCTTDLLMKNKFMNQIGLQQNVFTAAFLHESIDESHWAEKVVKTTKTSWHKTFPNADGLAQDFEDLAYTQDIPILASSTYAQYKVMQLVNQKNIKVTLDGQGADELFAGYSPHYAAYFFETLGNKSWSQIKANVSLLDNGFSNYKNLLSIPLKHAMATAFFPYFKKSGFRNSRPEFRYINSDLWNQNREQLDGLKNKFVPNLNQLLHQQFTGEGLKVLLRTGDRNSMRFSVESRMPFADDINLIEKIFSIPSSYKIHRNQSKSLLREAMKDILPNDIYHRSDKLGFATPEYKWLNEKKDFFKQYITSDIDSFVDSKSLHKNWDSLIAGLNPNATQRLFRIIKFSAWKKTFKL